MTAATQIACLCRRGTHPGAKLPEEISPLLSKIFSLTFNMLDRKVTSESQSHRTQQCAGLVRLVTDPLEQCVRKKKKCFLFSWKTIWQNLAVLHHFSLPLTFLLLPSSSERKRKKWHHMPLDVSNCLKIPYSLQKKQHVKVGLNCLLNMAQR